MIKKSMVIVFALLLSLMFATSGCASIQESTQTFEVPRPLDADGRTLRTLSIESKESYIQDRQKAVAPKLKEAVNSGKYNIVSVHTAYSDEYLTGAEIIYDNSGSGDGNKIRLLLVQEKEIYQPDKGTRLRKKLDALVNSGEYDIVKVNSIYDGGYMIAAEVYYRVK